MDSNNLIVRNGNEFYLHHCQENLIVPFITLLTLEFVSIYCFYVPFLCPWESPMLFIKFN
jgi:hypothetical protein